MVTSATEEEMLKGGNSYFNITVQNYAIQTAKLAAQKKGWKVKSTKVDEATGKVTMRLME